MTETIARTILLALYWIVSERAVSLTVIVICGVFMNSGKCSEGAKLSSMRIDPSLNGLVQDDPFLINTIKEHYIVPPSNAPHNLSMVSNDIEGQFGQATYIANTIYG